MKLHLVLNLIFLCFALSPELLRAGPESVSLELGTRVSLKSEILNEARALLVHLPEDYKTSNKTYPVLYLLDGERHFSHAILAARLLQEQTRVPELIIVAIPNLNVDATRERDLFHEREKFGLFLKNEVMTFVDKNYRTSGSNALFGHSLAAFFTVDMLANHADAFDYFIAAGPPLQGHEEELYKKITEQNGEGSSSLYLSLANPLSEGKKVVDAMKQFTTLLKDHPNERLHWKYDEFAEETHITNYYVSFFKGLTFVFSK